MKEVKKDTDCSCEHWQTCDVCRPESHDPKADEVQVGGSHYKDMDPQPWEVMQSLLTPEEFRGFLKGNMIKYAMRQGKKDSPDAGKYHHYKKKLAEQTGGDTWI